MSLALAIVFLWTGSALLYFAFHDITLESARNAPGDIIKSLRTAMEQKGNAYKSED